ncbi:MAG: 1-acyl-sn-glycerol-3-phosphate acyltransferase [Flavobacteriales bacterium]|jgi:1-acyl-sn-glycerol-3-phosphate acyltransferase
MSAADKNSRPYDDEGLDRHIEKALAVTPPLLTANSPIYKIIKRLFNPTLINTDNIPDQPCLFIGNHSLFAIDGMVLAPAMLVEQQRFLRGLGDRFMWTPKTEEFILRQGGVLGDPKVCSALMDAGHDLLVFPGGAHEATKTQAQRYTLQWKERFGFIKMAAKHGYTIMPMALVGPDEFYNHLIEGEDLPNTTVGKWLTKLGLLREDTRPDMLPPIPTGTLGSLIPKPQRCYIQFGQPVDLSDFKGTLPTKRQLSSIREDISEDIEGMLAELLLLREQNKGNESLWRRLLTV